jgi:hypothetical protein
MRSQSDNFVTLAHLPNYSENHLFKALHSISPHLKKNMKSIFTPILGFILPTFLIGTSTAAFIFNDGDLILGFQASGGTGSGKNVFFNLGSAVTLRDGTSMGIKGNINSTLASAYGADWYTRTDVYFGVIANGSAGSATDTEYPDYADPVFGDPNSTFYVSTPSTAAGTGTLYSTQTYGNSDLTNAGNTLVNTESLLPTLTDLADGAAILDQSTDSQGWDLGWSKYNPFVQGLQGAAFDSFSGGIQQNFGKGGNATFADIQRVLATNTGANPTGVVGGGTYEGTLAVSSNGTVTLIPEPSSAMIAVVSIGSFILRRRRTFQS